MILRSALLICLMVMSRAAYAAPGDTSTAPKPAAPARPSLQPGVKGTVIRPPPSVDPGIKAPTPKAEHFPMPVIKPPAQVVPK